MKLPSNKKILKEDLKGAPEWVNPLIDTINSFMETLYQAMNRNVTFNENISCFVKELTYKTPSTYPVMEVIEFNNTLKTRANGLLLMQALDKATYTAVDGPVYVPWVEVNGVIQIGAIKGLSASKTYIIRLLVI